MLSIAAAKKLGQPSEIWTQIHLNINHRYVHAAILEPVSQRLWMAGGYHCNSAVTCSDVLKISINPVPLKVLAAESAAKSLRADDTRLDPEQLPEELIKMVEGHRIS